MDDDLLISVAKWLRDHADLVDERIGKDYKPVHTKKLREWADQLEQKEKSCSR